MKIETRPDHAFWDDGIVDEVYRANCYRLDASIAGGSVVDIGAHIGSFSCLALDMGARHVLAIEAQADNFAQLCKNLSHYAPERSRAIHGAVWRSDLQEMPAMRLVPFCANDPNSNTGGCSLLPEHRVNPDSVAVDGVALDTLLRSMDGPVDLLKLDCEGSEYGIIYTSRWLRRTVRRIVMEYHRGSPLWVPGHDASPEALMRHLKLLCYDVDYFPNTEDLGLIFAR